MSCSFINIGFDLAPFLLRAIGVSHLAEEGTSFNRGGVGMEGRSRSSSCGGGGGGGCTACAWSGPPTHPPGPYVNCTRDGGG